MTFTLILFDSYPVLLEAAFAKDHFSARVVRARPTVDSTKVGAASRWLRGLDTKI